MMLFSNSPTVQLEFFVRFIFGRCLIWVPRPIDKTLVDTVILSKTDMLYQDFLYNFIKNNENESQNCSFYNKHASVADAFFSINQPVL